MSNQLNQRDIGIQILLENQKNQFESLLSAAALAEKMKVQLQGLFIEEDNLIRAADFPLSREVSRWSAEERQITAESVHRILRAHARCQQKELEKAANKANVACSFQVIRGERVRWIKENINTLEILFLGGHDLASKPFQSLRYCSEVTPPLITVFDGSVASERAFKIAVQIAENSKKPLSMILLVNELSGEQRIKEKINLLLRNHPNIALNVETITENHFSNASRKLQAHMLIFPTDIEWAKDEELLGKLIQQVHCPIVLVR